MIRRVPVLISTVTAMPGPSGTDLPSICIHVWSLRVGAKFLRSPRMRRSRLQTLFR
jgi:hypothetical protein